MTLIPRYATIGLRIRQIRDKYKLSQTKFAERIGISQRFLSDLERGKIKPPMPLLLAIEYVYRFKGEWVLTGDDPIYVGDMAPVVIPFAGIATSERQLKYWTFKLIRIFESGEKRKIEALKAQLRGLAPGEKKEGLGGTEGAVKAIKEKRRYYRFSISIPVDVRILDEPGSPVGVIIDASQMGLCVQSSHKMEIGEKIDLEIASSKSNDGTPCRTKAQIMWREGKRLDDSEAYQYGVKLVGLSDEDHAKLESLLGGGER